MPDSQTAAIHPITGVLETIPAPRQATMQDVVRGLTLAAATDTPEGYSSRLNVEWSDDERERQGLAQWLHTLADDLASGKARITASRYSFYHKLGPDFDGVMANLDSGDRTFDLVYHRPHDKQV